MNIGMLVSNEVVRDTRVLLEARSLVRHGHRVRIIGWDRFDPTAAAGPIGDGIEVDLVRTQGLMGSLRSDLFRNPLFWREAYRLARPWPADLWWAHDLDTLRPAVRLKRTTGKPLVFDAHEIFAEMIRSDYSPRVVRFTERMEARLLPHVDHIVTVNPAAAGHYERTGIPVTVVMNCREEIAERYTPPTAAEFTVLYVGTFHRQRFIFELIQAVQETEGVRLKIGGQKALSPEVQRACAASPRTEFLGPVPADRVMPLTAECHLVSAVLDPSTLANRWGSPNKLYEALAAGRPVLATKGTLSGNIVESESCGIAIGYNMEAAKWAIRKLSDDPGLQRQFGENALRAARAGYNWPAQEAQLLAVVARVGRRLTV